MNREAEASRCIMFFLLLGTVVEPFALAYEVRGTVVTACRGERTSFGCTLENPECQEKD